MSSKVKPCPFCGKAPIVGPSYPELDGDAWGFVKCVNTRCPAQPAVKDGAMVADNRGSAAYKALAVKRWNRRATPDTKEPRDA